MNPISEDEVYAELEEYSKHIAHNPTPKGRATRAYWIAQILQDREYIEPFSNNSVIAGLYKITEKGKAALKENQKERG
jgi:DNA-binding PadR family transcriptional regulator